MRKGVFETSNDLQSLAGTIYEELLYLTDEELLEMLNCELEHLNIVAEEYATSGQKDGWSEEETHPSISFLYTQSLERINVISMIMVYKDVNHQRMKHGALNEVDISKMKQDISSLLQAPQDITYTELLQLYPDQEIELIIEDLIRTGHLERIDTGYNKKGKWRFK